MHGVMVQVVTYGLSLTVLGYWLVSVAKTWQHRATFFLTLLISSICVRSTIGILVLIGPTILSIVLYERERLKAERAKRYRADRSLAFEHFPVVRWDGSCPLVVFDTNRYLYRDEVFNYVSSLDPDTDIRICCCRAVYLEQVEPIDLVGGCAINCDLPSNVQRALDSLNIEISHTSPVSWEQADLAVDLADLKARAHAIAVSSAAFLKIKNATGENHG
jgi:hypothetical protein